MELLVSLLGPVITVIVAIATLSYWLGKKFTAIDAKFREIDRRFREIDRRFEEIGRKFEEIDRRFESIDGKFEQLEKRLEWLGEQLRSELRAMTRALVSFTQSTQCLLIDFMTLKGLFTREERDFLVRELERLSRVHVVATNPLKPEEAKFILEVVQELKTKDPKEIDLSKLDRIIEIGERWLWEEGHPDAAKLILIAYTLKRILQKERGEL